MSVSDDTQAGSSSVKRIRKRTLKRTFLLGILILLIVVAAGVTAAFLYITHRVEGEYFDANGVRVHYTVEGKGQPVVLIHGFAVNADLNWRRQGITQALAKGSRVIAMDLRGHGLSGKPHDDDQYGLEMINDVIRLLDHLDIQKAHVVGYSLGGFITLKLGATYPERLLTISPLGSGWERPDNSVFLSAIPQLAKALESGSGIPPLSGKLGAEREKPGLLHTWWVKLMTRYFNDHQALVGVLRGIPEIALTEDELRQIPVPVCSVVGSRDPLKVGMEAMRGLVKDHTVVIVDGADHIRTPGRPELLDALMTFLRQHRDRE